MSKFSFSLLLLILVFRLISPDNLKAQRSFEPVNNYPSPDAHQAVAVDSTYFYAIATRSISKYDKTTGRQVARWVGKSGGAILHLDSGVILDGKLYAAHSNYPELPMTSSVEIWNTKTLEHIDSHCFGIRWGSCTWLDQHMGYWWAVFAHYEEFSDELGKDNRWTTLVKFNNHWEPME